MIEDTGKEGVTGRGRVLRRLNDWMESSGQGVKKEKRRMGVDTDSMEGMTRKVRAFWPNG